MADDDINSSDIVSLGRLGIDRAKQLPQEFATARAQIDSAINKLQNPGWTINAPLLAASLAMMGPTRTGSFGESLSHAGQAGIPALQQQRHQDLVMNSQLAQLAKEREQLALQESNALLESPIKVAGLENALQDLRFYQMMRESNMPSGGTGRGAANRSAIDSGRMTGQPGLDGSQEMPQGGGITSLDGGQQAPKMGGQMPQMQGQMPQSAGLSPGHGSTWVQSLPSEMQGRIGNLAKMISLGYKSGSKAGLERAGQAQDMLQKITGPGWVYDPVRGGFAAVGDKDPGYIGAAESAKNWSRVMPEAQIEAMKKQIDSGYEYVEVRDENGVPHKITSDMARQALGYNSKNNTRMTNDALDGSSGLKTGDSPVQEAGTKDVADYGTNLRKVFQTNQTLATRLENMQEILKNFESGAFAEHKSSLIAALRGIGIDVGDTDTANPEAVQRLMKEAIRETGEQARQISNRPSQMEWQTLLKANPGAGLQPGANAAIISQMLGLLDYDNQHYRDYVPWREKNPSSRNIDQFILDFTSRHNPEPFIKARREKMGLLKGEKPSFDYSPSEGGVSNGNDRKYFGIK